MRFLTKFGLALTIPAFVPAEPYPPLATVSHTDAGPSAWRECGSPSAIDGTIIRCGAENVRLLGIDTKQRNRCPDDSRCVQVGPAASRLSLQQAVSSGPVRYRAIKRGRYAGTVAVVAVKGGDLNLSCWQIRRGQADYVAALDENRIVARSCRLPLRRIEGGSNN